MSVDPLISIITVCFNSDSTIKNTIDSVLYQTYPNIEYIIIDGKSTDNTIDIVKKYQDEISIFLSEPDNGIYDAMNKGIDVATGDIIGILNSDDFYSDDRVIERIVEKFNDKNVDSVFANLIYVSSKNVNKVVRYFDSSQFKPDLFSYGLMPAHPTFFVKKSIYKKYGKFRTDLKNAADFDLMARFLYLNRVSYCYFDKVIVIMRMGGVSTSFSSMWTNNIEILNACKVNKIKTNAFKILLRYVFKALTLFKR
jgi:glycosyltransferase involved in cell wall biosynthesis